MAMLNTIDYKKILRFYNVEIPKSIKAIKSTAEDLIANKLCRCIKKIDTKYKAKAIGICTRTIFNNKGFTRGKFTCKKKQHVQFRKTRKRRTYKRLNT